MIFVDKPPNSVPDILSDPGKKGQKETKRAIGFYKKEKNSDKSFSFNAYRDKSIKKALEELFHGKCAYCESSYAETQPVDVEHWRPKGQVKLGNGNVSKPGYYWLAADWDNLLPSCIDCNREREQTIEPEGKNRSIGKKDKFPIEGNKFPIVGDRLKYPGNLELENPLILHPCKDQPQEHLQFKETEQGVIAQAKFTAPKVRSNRGLTSIEVYALNRTKLVQKRKAVCKLIKAQIQRVKEHILDLDGDLPEPMRERIKTRMKREMKILKEFLAPTSEYILMARQLIEPFFASIKP